MSRVAGTLATALALAASLALAGEAAVEKPSSPPLPFHTVEGTSGVFLTDTAYFCNCDRHFYKGVVGCPTVAASGILLHHSHLQAYTVTTNLFDRLELGYSYMRIDLDQWSDDVRDATGLDPQGYSGLHTLSTRYLLIKEGASELPWMPAVAAGVRYKNNPDIDDIDKDLMGTARAIGVRDDDGWEFTLTATKTFADVLPKPFILSAGLRSTEAAQFGLLGFSSDRDILFEGSAVFFITDRFLVGTEFRQKPDSLARVSGLVGREDDAWDLAVGYIINDHCTITGGYAHLGNVLNREENAAWALQIRWEF